MRISVIILSLSFLGLISCAEDAPPGVNLRLFNNSAFTIEQVQLQPGAAGTQTYTAIAPQQYSEYQPFPFTYSYAYMRVVLAGDTLEVIPIDYVGAEQYEMGNYTYRLTISGTEQPGSLVFEFMQD